MAVRLALWLEAMLPALAVKLAELAPAATVTEDGAVNRALLEANATADPPVGAAALSATVHVVEAPDARLAGLHSREDTVAAGAASTIEAVCELPLRVAVMVTVGSEALWPAVTVKLDWVAPAATITEDGAVNSVLLEASATLDPPVGAAALSVTVHVVEAPETRLAGLHSREDTVAAALSAQSRPIASCRRPSPSGWRSDWKRCYPP